MSHPYSTALKLTSKSVEVHNFIIIFFLSCVSLSCAKLQITLTTQFINSLTKLIYTSLKISRTSFATGSSSLLLLQDLPAAAQDHLAHRRSCSWHYQGAQQGRCARRVWLSRGDAPTPLATEVQLLLRWRPLGAHCYIKHISEFFRFFSQVPKWWARFHQIQTDHAEFKRLNFSHSNIYPKLMADGGVDGMRGVSFEYCFFRESTASFLGILHVHLKLPLQRKYVHA